MTEELKAVQTSLKDKDNILDSMNERIKALEQSNFDDLIAERSARIEDGLNKEVNAVNATEKASNQNKTIKNEVKELLPLYLEPFLNQIKENPLSQNKSYAEVTRENSIQARISNSTAKTLQARNKNNLCINIPAEQRDGTQSTNSIGTASSLLAMGRTPMCEELTENLMNSRNRHFVTDKRTLQENPKDHNTRVIQQSQGTNKYRTPIVHTESELLALTDRHVLSTDGKYSRRTCVTEIFVLTAAKQVLLHVKALSYTDIATLVIFLRG